MTKQEFNNVVDEFIEGKEYKQLRDSMEMTKSMEDLMERIVDKLQDWIDAIMKSRWNVSEGGEVSKVLSYVFLILAIMIIVIILAVIIINIRKAFEKKQKIKEILGEKITDKTTPLTLKKKAQEQEGEGHYRNAMRYHFIGVLLLMHEKSCIYLEETMTNTEIYAYLKKQEYPFLSQFYYSMNKFNHVWYGHKNFEMEAYREWKKNTDELWNEVNCFETKIQ